MGQKPSFGTIIAKVTLVEYYVARSAPPPVSDAMSNGKVFPEIVKSLRGYLTENKMPEFDFSDWTMSARILQGNRINYGDLFLF